MTKEEGKHKIGNSLFKDGLRLKFFIEEKSKFHISSEKDDLYVGTPNHIEESKTETYNNGLNLNQFKVRRRNNLRVKKR